MSVFKSVKEAAGMAKDIKEAYDKTKKKEIESVPIEGTGILWKPASENDGNLVILTPASWKQAEGVTVNDKYGAALDTGYFASRTNGNRCTYRFGLPGAGYPSPCFLKILGETYKIKNPSLRYD